MGCEMTDLPDDDDTGDLPSPEQILREFNNDNLSFEQAAMSMLAVIATAAWMMAADVGDLVEMARDDGPREKMH